MKKTAFYFSSVLWLCLGVFLSCGKKDSPTVVNGTVIDKNTGSPIEGVFIAFQITHKGEPPNNIETRYVNSDQNGNFHFEHDQPVHIFDLRKTGYLTKGGSSNFTFIKQGELNNLAFEMIPIDGNLSLTLENVNNQFDTIFVGVYSPTLDSETVFSNGIVSINAYIIPFGVPLQEDIELASNESVVIYWGFTPSMSLFETAPNKDTIFITENQTTFHTIHF